MDGSSSPNIMRRAATVQSKVRGFMSSAFGVFGQDIAAEVGRSVADPEDVYLPVVFDQKVPEAAGPLIEEARRVLKSVGGGYKRLRTFVPDATVAEAPFFVTGRKLSELMSRPPDHAVEHKGKLEAAVNRKDPYFGVLASLSSRSPALAGYCLAKCLLLADDRLLDRDVGLMKVALGARR